MSDMFRGCPNPEDLAAWVENPKAEPQILSHLASCDDCRRAAAIARGLDEPTGRRLDEALLDRVVAAARRRRPVWPWVAAAAAAVLAVILALPTEPEAPPETTGATPPSPPETPVAVTPPAPNPVPRPEIPPPPVKEKKEPVAVTAPEKEAPPPAPKEPNVDPVPPAKVAVTPETPAPKPEVTPAPAGVVATPPPRPGVEKPPVSPAPKLASVFLVDPEGEVWVERAGAKAVRVSSLQRIRVGDVISTRRKAGAIRVEGRASLVLDKGTQARVDYDPGRSAFRLTLDKGNAIIDTEGKPQLWEILGTGTGSVLSEIRGRLAVEPRKEGLAALCLDGIGELRVGDSAEKTEVGREVVVSPKGEVDRRKASTRTPQRRFDRYRPRSLTAFASGFELRSEERPYAFQTPVGRIEDDKTGHYLRAHTPGGYQAAPDGRNEIVARIVPAAPIEVDSGTVLRFRYRTNASYIKVNLGGYLHVYRSRTQGYTWRVAEIGRVKFEKDGVPMVPGERISEIGFRAEFPKQGGRLDVDSVHLMRRVR